MSCKGRGRLLSDSAEVKESSCFFSLVLLPWMSDAGAAPLLFLSCLVHSFFLFFPFFSGLSRHQPPPPPPWPSHFEHSCKRKKRDEGYGYHEKISMFYEHRLCFGPHTQCRSLVSLGALAPEDGSLLLFLLSHLSVGLYCSFHPYS